MDETKTLLEQLDKSGSIQLQEKTISQLIKFVCELSEDDNDNDDAEVQKLIMENDTPDILLSHLKKNSSPETENLLEKTSQLIAELAKVESLREPLVTKGFIESLLTHLPSENIALATQVCRALGNICYDNDPGRLAVDKGDGIATILNVLSSQIPSVKEGAARLRIIVCGFLLNLTNDCEPLQEKAIEANVLELLNECVVSHLDDEDLSNMALLTIGSITDSDLGKTAASKTGLLDTVKALLDRECTDSMAECLLSLSNSIMESECVKEKAADIGLCDSLVKIVQSDSNAELLKLASDVLVSILVGDASMEKLYDSGEGSLFLQCMEWLSSDKENLKILGSLAIGNFARRDTYCLQLVDKGAVEKLISLLTADLGSGSEFYLQHAVLSTLRNLAIPAANKSRLQKAGVMDACLCLINSEVMAVVFKLLGVMRMLIEGQQAAAVKLGQERNFLDCLSDWCTVEAHAGVKGEAPRVIASLVKNSRSSAVVQNLIRAECMGPLVAMAMCEHRVMQNEAIMALTIVSSLCLTEAAVALREADLAETIAKLLKDETFPAEMMCNLLSLVKAISSAASPSVPPPCALLTCAGLMPDVRKNLQEEIVNSGAIDLVRMLCNEKQDLKVRDAAKSALTALEESLSN